ncbi:14272_t:CDS:1, partial [Racocetra persica]
KELMGIWLDRIRTVEINYQGYKQLRSQPHMVHIKKLHSCQTSTLDFINE